MLIRVALPVPLYRVFDYLPFSSNRSSNPPSQSSPSPSPSPSASTLFNVDGNASLDISHNSVATNTAPLPVIGTRVQVPFANRKVIGIVVAHIAKEDSDVPVKKLKSIAQVFDEAPLLNEEMLSLGRWLASYYHYPLGDVYSVMLPTLIRQGKPLDFLISHWRLVAGADEALISPAAKRQQQQFNILKLHGTKGASEDTLFLEGIERPFLNKLEAKGLIEHYLEPKPHPKPVSLAKLPLDLNPEQAEAVKQIIDASDKEKYTGFLLNGVTGSGKTEVYLQAMEPILTAGKQVLILVPEIGLTPQTRARFAKRFATEVLLLHSGINNTQRMQGWEDCRQGRVKIIIGTRSAILYPYVNLGLIVVDEAHDQSYKQQDTLRYQAADVALYRGYQASIPVVMGTATPSLDHLKLVQDGKLTELTLNERAGTATKAKLQLVDARDTPTAYSEYPAQQTPQNQQSTNTQAPIQKPLIANVHKPQNTGLTQDTVNDIRRTLEAGDQVLVFLNRRGYAPILLCDACGWQADCVRCEAHMTVHHSQLNRQSPSYLKCHHCDWQANIPSVCPDCRSTNLDAVGMGTTRLTESLHALFSNPQNTKNTYPIIQIDRDTTRRKNSWEDIYARINSGKPAILVGTQMVAKGHHFPRVTLVCIPNADRGFLSANFRSPEHTAQLIIQVAGRSGRGQKPGRVLIQTVQPDNPLLQKLVQDGYQAFAEMLLAERKMMGLPPYTYSALIRCEGKTLDSTTKALSDALAILPPNNLAILGPVAAPMKKKNSRYHSQVFILSKERPQLHQLLATWWPQVLQLPSAKYLRLSLDIDPVGW